jgi:NAD(P)-dependent dehydrogenase (short-subunit alcohol dehydrogenase family)
VANPDLSGKRVLLLRVESEVGGAIAEALAEAGARLGLVAASNDSESAFAVQRLARRLGADVSQAIDATNETATRVMARQMSKALGGLDAVILAPGSPNDPKRTFEQSRHLIGSGMKELDRQAGGHLILVFHGGGSYSKVNSAERSFELTVVHTWGESPSDVATWVVAALAAPAS